MPDLNEPGSSNTHEFLVKGKTVQIEAPGPGATQLQVANAVDKFFRDAELDPSLPDIQSNRGLWSYLAYLLIDSLLPPKGKAVPKDWYYIHSGARSSHYRHFLWSSVWGLRKGFQCVNAGEHAWKSGECREQIFSGGDLLRNPHIIELMDELFLRTDPKGKVVFKKGALDKHQASIRAFKRYVKAIAETWHIPSMTREEILDKLPKHLTVLRTATECEDPLA